MSSCKINDIFPYINTKEFESFAVKAVTAQLNKEGLQPVEEIKFTLDTYCKEQQFSYVGYIPAVLSVSMSTTYLGGNAHKDNWLSKFALGTFAHDASNCGVGSVHNINGLTQIAIYQKLSAALPFSLDPKTYLFTYLS